MERHAGRQVVVELGETNIRVRVLTGGDAIEPTWDEPSGVPGRLAGGVVIREDGSLQCGVEPWGQDGADVVTGFLARVDDDVSVIVGREAVPAATLVAAQLCEVLHRVEAEFGSVALLTVIHPDVMTEGSCRRITCHLPASVDVRWQSRAATVLSDERTRRTSGSNVALVHVGGATVEASVWEAGPRPRCLGDVVTSRVGGGDAADDLVLRAVRETFGESSTHAAMSHLRASCRDARQRLDRVTAADVTAADVTASSEGSDHSTPGGSFRLVRSELQEITRPVLEAQLTVLRTAIDRADLAPEDVKSVILVGGGATAPGTVEAFSTLLERPVHVVARPSTLVAEDPGYIEVAPAVDADGPPEPSAPQDTKPVTGIRIGSHRGPRIPATFGPLRRRVPVLAAVAASTVIAMGATASALPGTTAVVDLIADAVGLAADPDGSVMAAAGVAPPGQPAAETNARRDSQWEWSERLRSALGKTVPLILPNAPKIFAPETSTEEMPGGPSGHGSSRAASDEKGNTGKPDKSPNPNKPDKSPNPNKPTNPGQGTPKPKPSSTTPTPDPTTPTPDPTTPTPDPTTPTPDPTTPTPDPTTPDPDPTTPDPDPTTPDPDPTTPAPDPTTSAAP